MINRNECDRHLCTLFNWAKLTNAKIQYLFIERKKWWSCGGNPSTGGKTTTNLQKIIPKSLGIQKKKKDQKFGDAKKEKIKNKKIICINAGNN